MAVEGTRDRALTLKTTIKRSNVGKELMLTSRNTILHITDSVQVRGESSFDAIIIHRQPNCYGGTENKRHSEFDKKIMVQNWMR